MLIQDCTTFLFKSANAFAFSLNVLIFCWVESIAASATLFCTSYAFTISSVVSRITFSAAEGTLVVIPDFEAKSLCNAIVELITF